jgi:hypothetical protein
MAVNSVALQFLDELERAEARLLTWGLIEGFFAENELEELANTFIAGLGSRGISTPYSSGWDLVDALLDAHLLWRVPATERYRTRMAEAVRLFSRLRQIFPDGRNEAWRTAPGLVADYRLIVRPRLFPVRDVGRDELKGAIKGAGNLTRLQEKVIDALLAVGGEREISLARFQVRASERMLRANRGDRASGTIVSAGTGSGKTLAFYLPAFALIAEMITGEYWTKCLALYPRNELLKDQFREALANARRIGPALAGSRKRRLVVAALYGDVPHSGRNVMDESGSSAWKRVTVAGQSAYVCPFVRCPACGEDMAWLASDITNSVERLQCTQNGCGERVEADEVRLTRERMLAEPPDVLFTSTEMLNQRLSSSRYGGLFGVGVRSERRPPLVLIDEVHTYEGVHGAQVALLLRRWRRAADVRPHFVGLSATLADAPRFFGDLVGLGQGDVVEITPDTHEMMARGAEYMLALRGDPSSGTSLLSTTIQASMLLRRVLATANREPSGRKVFAFTDNLDVINRLYHSVLDAEGWDSWGRPNPKRAGGSLANLRGSTLPNARERLEHGQNWAMVEDIGHVLAPGQRVRVGRTSSQDAGVDPDAQVVVATAALEVGFDDPEVGGVLQHKAPHSPAAFLQRKGRAGRRQDMRPWTVVVLSDYGRDRTAYQSYDQLFSPTLPPRHLPLANRAVLRMQAAYALCDWLARRLPPNQQADPWSDFSQPASAIANSPFAQRVADRQTLYAQFLRALLEQRNVREEFTAFLARALAIGEDEAIALLWEAPRAVLTEVVPTLLRRLETGWRRAGIQQLEPYTWRVPLPEFLPRTLFSDLHVPDVEIRLPAIGRLPARSESMPVAQALQEFAPGRVSKRFGVSQSGERHWITPGDGRPLSIDTFCPPTARQGLGSFRFVSRDGQSRTVDVFRPYSLVVDLTPLDVQQSSNSFLEWHAEILPTAQGHTVDQPERGTRWTQVLKTIRVHAHHLGAPVELRRFAVGARATVGRGRQSQATYGIRFASPTSESEDLAGLGFVADVDAVEVTFAYPPTLHERCQNDPLLLRGLRTARFRDAVRTSAALDGIVNAFQRDWLSQAYLSAATAEALRKGISLESAAELLRSGASAATITEVLETLLQWGDEADGDHDSGGHDRPRRLNDLVHLLADPVVPAVLHGSASYLWSPLDDEWESWLRARFKGTLAAAMIEAAHSLCPRMSDGALLADLGAVTSGDTAEDLSDGDDRFWLTETTIGGGGFVEELLTKYAEDPRRYFRFLDAALDGSDLESVSDDLGRVLAMVSSGSDEHRGLIVAFETTRVAASHEESVQAVARLRAELSQRGVLPGTTLLVALNTRLLGPGTSAETDGFMAKLLRDWSSAEQRLGVDIDARVFALVKSADDALERALQVVPPGDSPSAKANWRFGVLAGMLWPRGTQLRVENLRLRNPFEARQESDRLLLLSSVLRPVEQVRVDAPDWFSRLSSLLLREGAVELTASVEESRQLAAALLYLGTEPIDSEAVLVHARVTGVMRDGDQLKATIELPEALQ